VPGAPIDLNTAGVDDLDTLPGVGPATAQAIVAHRDEHGPFGAVDDLLEVRGIGDARLEALRDLVTV
jgi:competence protein ComEA